jgi:hypothetical protein
MKAPRINQKYLAFLGVLVVLYFVLLYFMPQRFNWFITLYQKDKNPFGAYVFKTLIDHSWLGPVQTSNKTIYELGDLDASSLVVLCEDFSMSSSEQETFLNLVEHGKTALISAHHMDSVFTDTLGVRLNSLSFNFYIDQIWGADSTGLRFMKKPWDNGAIYWLPKQMLSQHFVSFDSARTEVIAINTDGNPVLLRIAHGKGIILLSSTPLMFSNFAILNSQNEAYIAGLMSCLPTGSLHWTEYYQLGRMEATTPLRYILSEPALKWAFFTLIFTTLILMLFEAKRDQRIIPIISPLKNETLDFVKTISRLYYQKKDHKDLATKKILHITEYLRQHLQIDINEDLNEVIGKVAAKTLSDEQDVKIFFDQMNQISSSRYISAIELKTFMDRAEQILNES